MHAAADCEHGNIRLKYMWDDQFLLYGGAVPVSRRRDDMAQLYTNAYMCVSGVFQLLRCVWRAHQQSAQTSLAPAVSL